MVSNRQIRLVGLAVLGTLVIFVLYNAGSSDKTVAKDATFQLNNQQAATSVLTSNNLIDSDIDDKKDAAINNEILQLGNPLASSSPSSSDAPSGDFDAPAVFLQIRSLAPMTIFSKTYCPYSKKVKALLHDNYEITPEPTIVELDKHANGKELQDYVGEITGRSTVPNVLVGALSDSRGGADDFVKLHEEGKLLGLLNEWGNKKLVVKKIKAPSNV